jgi:hypothetical protein
MTDSNAAWPADPETQPHPRMVATAHRYRIIVTQPIFELFGRNNSVPAPAVTTQK